MSVFFLGPLPPPMHGFAAINAKVVDELRSLCDVQVFDRAPPSKAAGAIARLRMLLTTLLLGLKFFVSVVLARPAALYVGVSGGAGQLLDLPFLVLARLIRLPIFAHHHSFAYINQPGQVSRCLMKVLNSATHVVLCEAMGAALNREYGIQPDHIFVLSNAAFLDDAKVTREDTANNDASLRIGFLSNIIEEKGIFDFFRVAEALHTAGISFQGFIAGPVALPIAERFAHELQRLPSVVHVGPVYGKEKDAFYGKLDVLLFPTRYANEAEPVTILEALSAGVVVLAAQRGCIGEMFDTSCGVVVDIEHFHVTAVEEIIALTGDRLRLDSAKQAAHACFDELNTMHRARLKRLLGDVVAGQPTRSMSS